MQVTDEQSDIYPPKICASCTAVLYRLRNAKKFNRAYNANLSLFIYTPHTEKNCLCTQDENTSFSKKAKLNETNSMTFPVVYSPLPAAQLLEDQANSSETQEDQLDSSILKNAFDAIPNTSKEFALESFVKSLSPKNREYILKKIIEEESMNISLDIEDIQTHFQNVRSLSQFDIKDYMQKRNPIARCIVQTLSKVSESNSLNSAILLE